MWTRPRNTPPPPVSDPEQLMFGGPLRYDTGWSKHEDAYLQLGLRALATPVRDGWSRRSS
ncbi:hypothetical protein [Streptomyces paludis]|uniref:hypothetical protein n=1 Tax=Streptomyces paludis TaxID=2282738 RepID=UPI0013B4122E|nr:hypothetical protein [Streptomyces paludis]